MYLSLKNSLGLNLSRFSVFFPPCCCSICYIQGTKPWALQPSPPSNWMMPSVSCGGHTLPPLLTHCPSSRTGTGTRDLAKEDLPICMPLWKIVSQKSPHVLSYFRPLLFRLHSSFCCLAAWDDQWEMAAQAVMDGQAVGLKIDADSSLGAWAWVRSCI